MRILMLNHNVKWKSTFHRCYHFGGELVQNGHQVTILTISPQARWKIRECYLDGIQVVETPDLLWGSLRSGWDLWDTLWRFWYLRRPAFDLVHAFDSRPNVILPALLLKHRYHLPFFNDWADWWGRGGVISIRDSHQFLNTLFAPVETFFEEHFRRDALALSIISTALCKRAELLGISPAKIRHIPNGSDVVHIRPLPRQQARSRLGLPLTAKIVVFTGFVHYDMELLLKSFALLRKKRSDVILLLVGPKTSLLDRFAPTLREQGSIYETGAVPRSELLYYLACADVLLLPYSNRLANSGRFPLKLGDYMAAGRPILSNPVGDVGTIIRTHQIGVLANDNPESYAQALLELLEQPKLCEKLGARARQVAETYYSWNRVTRDLERFYGDFLPGLC